MTTEQTIETTGGDGECPLPHASVGPRPSWDFQVDGGDETPEEEEGYGYGV
jgi:hypothetical protein